MDAHFFVSTFGFSGYPYDEAFPDVKLRSWQRGNVISLNYYGRTPLIVVPDKCNTAVSKPRRYDPVINPAYWELVKHYNVAVIPARIRELKGQIAGRNIHRLVGNLAYRVVEKLDLFQFCGAQQGDISKVLRVAIFGCS